MDEKQKLSQSQQPKRELTREERMRRIQRKKRARRQRQIAILCLTIVAVIIFIAMILFIKKSLGSDKLQGTWVLDESTSYQFDGDENGAMLISDSKYRFTYEIKKDKLFIDYENDILVDGEYTFKVKKDVLTLIGGEGTSGNTYELNKKD